MLKSGSKNFEQNIRKYFEWQDYQVLPVCLSNVIFSEKEAKYHLKYRIKYETVAEANIKHKKGNKLSKCCINARVNAGYWRFNREVHKKAYETLSCYLKEAVIKNKEVLLLVDFNRYYQHLLTEFGGDEFIDVTSISQKLKEIIRKHNGDDL